MSFKELGHAILAREDSWICITVLRSSSCKELLGGVAQLVGGILRKLFCDEGRNLHEIGIHLSHEDGSFRLHAQLGIIVQDGAAHKEMWSMKGDGGMRMCLTCDIISSNTEIVEFAPTSDLKQNIIKSSDLTFYTDEHVKDTAHRLKAFHDAGAADFDDISKVMGRTVCRYMLLTDILLRNVIYPSTQLMHDWMHGLFSNGVFNLLMHYVLEDIEADFGGNIYPILAKFFCNGKWPKRLNLSGLEHIFATKRRNGNRKV